MFSTNKTGRNSVDVKNDYFQMLTDENSKLASFGWRDCLRKENSTRKFHSRQNGRGKKQYKFHAVLCER